MDLIGIVIILIILGGFGYVISCIIAEPNYTEIKKEHTAFCASKGMNFTMPFSSLGMSNQYKCYDNNSQIFLYLKHER